MCLRLIKFNDHLRLPTIKVQLINHVGARGGAGCLGHCTTSRKVAGSIPDDVIGIFH